MSEISDMGRKFQTFGFHVKSYKVQTLHFSTWVSTAVCKAKDVHAWTVDVRVMPVTENNQSVKTAFLHVGIDSLPVSPATRYNGQIN